MSVVTYRDSAKEVSARVQVGPSERGGRLRVRGRVPDALQSPRPLHRKLGFIINFYLLL